MATSNLTKEQKSKLRDEAKLAAQKAYSPYSKVNVGSALMASDDQVFSGCNIENSSFGATICAERTAIFKLVSSGQVKFKAIYVYTEAGWPPCGMCRQVMLEFADENCLVLIGDSEGNETEITLKELVPLSFNSDHLLEGN